MKIITQTEFVSSLWKNGAGTTREIARKDGPKGYFWRLSIAKVTCDSIFSTFPGMARILTVIEGEGLVLQAGELTQNAARNAPVSFAGATPITGRLYDGPVQNFNVIYDPRLTAAGVQILDAGLTTVLPARPNRTYAVYCLRGVVKIKETFLDCGSIALIDHAEVRLKLPEASLGLQVQLDALNRIKPNPSGVSDR